MNKFKLICLPFAGGSRYAYHRFAKLSPDWLDIVPMDIPGRGNRIGEKPMTCINKIVEDILDNIINEINEPYAIFGHSMGALTTLLLARKIRERQLPQPLHLFVTGHGAPATDMKEIIRSTMTREELIEELKALDGMPEDVLNDEVLLDYCLPILRADFEAIETHKYVKEEKLDVPITCVIGKDENITTNEALAWQDETNNSFELKHYPGRHFFIFNYEKELIRLFCKTLNSKLVLSY